MRKPITPTLLLLGLLAAAFLAGCSDEETRATAVTPTGKDDYLSLDFSLENGGLTATDEEVAFGDDNLKGLLAAEELEAVDDPLAESPEVQELAEQAEAVEPAEMPRFTFLRLRWGMIHGPADSVAVPEGPCDILDWTGRVHIDRGLIVVRRLIAFEYPLDRVIFPRVDPRLVAFTSHTACHYDGLVLQICESSEDYAASEAEPNRLHIDTGPFQGVYEVAELAGLDDLVDIDGQGNGFQLAGFTPADLELCPKGFLSGAYLKLRLDPAAEETADPATGRQVGLFLGPWLTLDGRIRGFLQGGYGFDAEGRQVLVGKYVDRTGRFLGFVRGQWLAGAEPGDLAEFSARWAGASGAVNGTLGGVGYPVSTYAGGFYVGRWTAVCDDRTEELVR